MLFPRADYTERIVDTAGRIPADEPVFLLRATDALAPAVLDYWIVLLSRATGGDSAMIARLQAHAETMRAWGREHGATVPDADEDDLGPRPRFLVRVTTAEDPTLRLVPFDTEEARAAYHAEHAGLVGVSLEDVE